VRPEKTKPAAPFPAGGLLVGGGGNAVKDRSEGAGTGRARLLRPRAGRVAVLCVVPRTDQQRGELAVGLAEEPAMLARPEVPAPRGPEHVAAHGVGVIERGPAEHGVDRHLRDARRTEKNSPDDCRGVDLVVETDRGPVFLQVKSSDAGARNFKRKRLRRRPGASAPDAGTPADPIGLVVVRSEADDDLVGVLLLEQVATLRGLLPGGGSE
jgi:hypothetical protein